MVVSSNAVWGERCYVSRPAVSGLDFTIEMRLRTEILFTWGNVMEMASVVMRCKSNAWKSAGRRGVPVGVAVTGLGGLSLFGSSQAARRRSGRRASRVFGEGLPITRCCCSHSVSPRDEDAGLSSADIPTTRQQPSRHRSACGRPHATPRLFQDCHRGKCQPG